MSDIETSPLGDIREHRVPCRGCLVLTWNWSSWCSACLDDDSFAEAFQPLPGEEYTDDRFGDDEALENAVHSERSVRP